MQRKYSTTEKGFLARYLAMKKWLLRARTIVYTDNKNLMGETFDFGKKTIRWKVELSEFRIDMHQINGKDNKIANYLTRGKLAKITKITKSSAKDKIQDRELEIKEFHTTHGHPGMKATYYTWKKIKTKRIQERGNRIYNTAVRILPKIQVRKKTCPSH